MRQEGDERGAREQAKQRGTRRARGKHSPAYHSMSRGGCQGEYAPWGHFGFPQTGRRERGIPMHGKGARGGALDARGAY